MNFGKIVGRILMSFGKIFGRILMRVLVRFWGKF